MTYLQYDKIIPCTLHNEDTKYNKSATVISIVVLWRWHNKAALTCCLIAEDIQTLRVENQQRMGKNNNKKGDEIFADNDLLNWERDYITLMIIGGGAMGSGFKLRGSDYSSKGLK